MPSLLVAALALAISADSIRTGSSVRGRVLDGWLDQPLANAIVRLQGSASRQTALTSPDGSFAFAGVLPGRYSVSIERFAYVSTSFRVEVPFGREVIVDVQLTPRPSELKPVVVLATADDPVVRGMSSELRVAEDDPTTRPNALRFLSGAGGAFASMMSTARNDGSSGPGGGRGRTLFVWGAGEERDRVVLDGATLSAPLHLGGLLPAFDPELIDARSQTAGTSPRYDGATGEVLELTTRAPSRGSRRFWGSADLLTSRVGAELPLGDSGSLLVGGRHVNDRVLSRLTGTSLGYSYDDALARLSLGAPISGRLMATVFGSDEALRLPRDLGTDRAAWRNRAASLTWRSQGDGGARGIQVATSQAMMDLPMLSTTGGHLRSDIGRTSLLAEQSWVREKSAMELGAQIERLTFRRDARITSGGAPNVLPLSLGGVPVGDVFTVHGESCPIDGQCASATATAASLYGGFQRTLSEKVELSTGLRLNTHTNAAGRSSLMLLPRLALESELTSRTIARVSFGRFSQLDGLFRNELGAPPLGFGATGSSAGSPADVTPTLPPSRLTAMIVRSEATELELELERRMGRSTVIVGAFAHRLGAERLLQVGASRSAGLEATWTHQAKRLNTALDYALVRRTFDEVAFGEERSRTAHLISATADATAGRARLSVSASYAQGLPFSSIALEGPESAREGIGTLDDAGADAPPMTPPDRPYVRLDVTASTTWCLCPGERRWSLVPYVRLVNALDRRDALFYYHDGSLDGRTRRLAALPALASVGLRWDVGGPKR
jgi:hypothetical protein